MTKETTQPEENKNEAAPVETPVVEAAPVAAPVAAGSDTNQQGDRSQRHGGGQSRGGFGRGGQGQGQGGGRGRGRGKRRNDEPKDEFDSTIVDLARVTRVMAGGKRMSFRACVLVGDKKGRVGMGVKKGADVQLAVQKATTYAKKHIFTVPVVEGTIPHTVYRKFKGASIMLRPGRAGSGIIAGGPVRMVMEMVGINNIVAKMKGSNNKINNLSAVLEALRELRTKEEIEQLKK